MKSTQQFYETSFPSSKSSPTNFSSKFYGIDVSHHQGNINWQLVVNNVFEGRNLSLVFMKASEGKNFLDEKFQENWEAVNDRNEIKISGAYHFYQTNVSGKEQAENLLSQIRNLEFGAKDFYIIDVESNKSVISNKEFAYQITQFQDTMKDNGFQNSMIYTRTLFWNQNVGEAGANLWRNNLEECTFEKSHLWLSRYGKNDGSIPEGAKYYTEVPIGADLPSVWQFTNHGNVAGIVGDVDLNLLSEDLTC